MARHGRAPVALVMGALLVVAGLASVWHPARNPSSLPSGLSVAATAESTALYCTGLAATTHRPGRVTLFNTSSSARTLAVSVVSNEGHAYSTTFESGAHASQSIQPSVVDKGNDFAVAVQVSGGGVVGEEVAGTDRSEAPCATEGSTHWYAAGFDTLVGSSAYVSVYNPTATSAVFNVSLYSAAGYSAPQSFQGVSVPAHAQVEVDLGTQIVDTTDVGVGIRVLRGSLVFTGVQDSDGTLSLDQGSSSAALTSWFPDVTTATSATAALRVANPGPRPADVRVTVQLGRYRVPVQSVTVPPFSTGVVAITPNSAIPAAGYAALTVRSNEPVVANLATGTGDWITLTAPVAPARMFVVHNFTSLGFDAATVTNTSSRAVHVDVADEVADSATSTSLKGFTLDAHQTQSLASVSSSLRTSTGDAYLVTAPTSVVVGLTLPGRPAGLDVVAPLDGR